MVMRLAALFCALVLGWAGPTAAGLGGSHVEDGQTIDSFRMILLTE